MNNNQTINFLEQAANEIATRVNQANTIDILLGSNDYDTIAAGLGFSASLIDAKKTVNVFASQGVITQNYEGLLNLDQIKSDIGQENMIIELNYPLDKIEKVSSSEKDDRLRLVVKLKDGAQSIKTDQVAVITQREKANLGFVFSGTDNFNLPENFMEGTEWVSFKKDQLNDSGWINLPVHGLTISYSDLIARIVSTVGLPMNSIVGTNLYRGIYQATNAFRDISDYKTLEVAALCFRSLQQNGIEKNFSEEVKDQEVLTEQHPENIENKEMGTSTSGFPAPRIFKGSTTPKI